jgi:hypothetical protein
VHFFVFNVCILGSVGRDKRGAGEAQGHPEAAAIDQVQLAPREVLHPESVRLDKDL